MRKANKNLAASLLGFSLLLAACSGTDQTPEAIAFQDDSSGGSATVNRPTTNPCAANEFFVEFDEDVVLLDPAATTAGPFDIELPAGTYDVLVSTWLGFEEIEIQTMEQWFFTTDSGYTSPLTTDPSPELLMNQQLSLIHI